MIYHAAQLAMVETSTASFERNITIDAIGRIKFLALATAITTPILVRLIYMKFSERFGLIHPLGKLGRSATCKLCVSARARAWKEANPGKSAATRRLKTYNLSSERFNEMVAAQNGRCAICGISNDRHEGRRISAYCQEYYLTSGET